MAPLEQIDDVLFVHAEWVHLADGQGPVTVTTYGADGAPRVVASWTATAVESAAGVAASVSPDRRTVAVSAGGVVQTIDLRDGAETVRWSMPDSWSGIAFGWADDGALIARDLVERSGPALPLGNGWEMQFSGVIDTWQRKSTSEVIHQGASLLGFGDATERSSALNETREEREQVETQPIETRLRLSRAGVSSTICDLLQTGLEGRTVLSWPPIVADHGVFLRTAIQTYESATNGADSDVIGVVKSDAQPVVLVRPTGAVDTLPFTLGFAPICALTGGLLISGPSIDDLDVFDQRLHLVMPDGSIDVLIVSGTPIDPDRIVRETLGERSGWTSDGPVPGSWEVVSARPVHDGRQLLIVLGEPASELRYGIHDDVRWLVALAPLAGDGAIRLIAHGQRQFEAYTAIAH